MKTSEKRWWLLTIVWFVAVGLGWTAFFWRGESVGLAPIHATRWMATVQAVSRIQRSTTKDDLSSLSARLMNDVRALSYPRHTTESRKRARAYIAHSLTDMGYRPMLHAFTSGINVITKSQGQNDELPILVVGAHYDSVANSPGSDDNATGVAAVLEIARRLKTEKHQNPVVLAFWDAEEKGLLGSSTYLASEGRRERISGAIILEMLGYACHEPRCQQTAPGIPATTVPDRGDFIAVIGDLKNPALLLSFAHASTPNSLKSVVLPVFDGGWPIPQTRRSDHASFWDRDIGAVMVTDTANFRNPHYHTQTDTPETLSPDFLAATTEYVWRALKSLVGVVASP